MGFSRARRNFVESLAAYSIVCYVFQIKDRHNGNILLDTDGHVIHIDFGFLLTNSPGSNLNFERAPFKLTDEFVELMGGPRSSMFRYFRSLCIRAYLALRRDMEKIVLLVEMMLVGNADLPCFAGGKKAVVEGLRARLKPGARTSTCQLFVNQLIDQSINNWRTRWYDKYQRACLGIR
jgi:phosphatidylinositol kinase/protein kinase (PI-3  family)